MLIIAGVAISAIDGGVLHSADDAREQTNLADLKERTQFAIQAALTDAYNNGSRALSRSLLENKLNKTFGEGNYIITGEEAGPWEIKIDGLKAIINKNGKIENVNNTDNESNQGGDNESNQDDGGNTINWEEIKADLPTNYSKYLTLAQAKGQSEDVNIGIGTDGEVVNLDLWHYYDADDGDGKSLGTGETSTGTRGYDEEDLVDNKVQGKTPQYIYIKEERSAD